jgi:hypothetical protein
MTRPELVEKYWDFEEHTWKWPPEDGFKDNKYDVTDRIPDGQRLDRIGVVSDRTGNFMATEGDSYPARAMAPGSSGDYNVFEGTGKQLPAGWEVRVGEVGEAFDLPGGPSGLWSTSSETTFLLAGCSTMVICAQSRVRSMTNY